MGEECRLGRWGREGNFSVIDLGTSGQLGIENWSDLTEAVAREV